MSKKETTCFVELGDTKVISCLASGEEVFVTPQSHFYSHPDTHEAVYRVLPTIDVNSLSFDDSGLTHTAVEVKGMEGRCLCVPVTDSDKFVYAKRKPRTWYTRFVIGREVSKTNLLTLVIKKQGDGYELSTSYWGPCAYPEPSDPCLSPGTPEYEISEKFWRQKALVLPSDEASLMSLGIDPGQIKESLEAGEEYFRSV
ncbi:hypothetical protein COW83_02660 [Candidatus Collierbacteria bacterium CG22_combo_CG10-13_8_21_14_all_43_12]|uniref:Uncharacterized protein n=2 Tax=Candidatus Collieribacteriota TaxID=1752725 RepID=A0A2H0DVY4_9BACT|nr:hypothetical protein [bacterium]PIP85760.1 MAG: hypothetical protein COW83_02660 [Candidatus Collierbacteria bacterium CG22_combo_CG10-13_8_21_14_all_43_12]